MAGRVYDYDISVDYDLVYYPRIVRINQFDRTLNSKINSLSIYDEVDGFFCPPKPTSGFERQYFYSEIETTSTVKLDEDYILIAPNPVTNQVNIIGVDPGTSVLNVFNTKGELYLKDQVVPVNKTISIDCANYPAGIYYFRIETQDKYQIGSFIKI